MIFLLLLCSILLTPFHVFSQEVRAKMVDVPIRVDGIFEEGEWEGIDAVSGFFQFEPVYGKRSAFPTKVYVAYDERMIYFGFECEDPDPQRISTKVTRRDGEVWEDDAVAFVLDTFDDGNNAYFFIVNALGTQQDERWADNGRTRDVKWDAEWYSAGRVHGSGWRAEVAIPFRVLRFDRSGVRWGFNAIRYVPRNLERSFWKAKISEWFRISEYGAITELDLKNVTGKKFDAIPYVQFQFERGKDPAVKTGGDLRYQPSSNIGLDLAVNPDFATIEGDVEQINFTRFELSYPEKRPFFMEGGENYETRIRQFYSRRIGEIPWGVKLNGKISRWKLNVLATQSDPSSTNPEIPPGKDALYTVFRINRDVGNASTVGIIGANRTYDDKNEGSIGLVSTLFFSRVLGMTAQVIRSYGAFDEGAWTYFFRPAYDSKTTHFHVRYTHVGEHVQENMNDIGFIRDDDRKEVDSNLTHKFWVNRFGIELIEPSLNYNRYWSQAGVLRSWELSSELSIQFRKRWTLALEYDEEFKRYEKDFRNYDLSFYLRYDNKKGLGIALTAGTGDNFDRDFERCGLGLNVKIMEGWDVAYQIDRYWFHPDYGDDNSLIHYVRTTYYVNKDLFVKLFYQSKYGVKDGLPDLSFDLLRETLQFVFVWRILPPFGSLQLAYQEGTTRFTQIEGSSRTLFVKLSWVF